MKKLLKLMPFPVIILGSFLSIFISVATPTQAEAIICPSDQIAVTRFRGSVIGGGEQGGLKETAQCAKKAPANMAPCENNNQVRVAVKGTTECHNKAPNKVFVGCGLSGDTVVRMSGASDGAGFGDVEVCRKPASAAATKDCQTKPGNGPRFVAVTDGDSYECLPSVAYEHANPTSVPQPGTPGNSANPNDAGAADEEEPTCGTMAPGVGWYMCPLTTAAATFADGIWKLFETQLVTDPLQSSGPYYELWGNLRNIANAILAILFLAIIMSQVSNLGISNYGIKKTLPKLLLMAVAINISFVIVQYAVDLANALGSLLLGFIEDQTPSLPPRGLTGLLEEAFLALGALGAGVGLTVAAGAIATPTAVIVFFLMILIPAIIGIVAGFLTLVIRESVIPFLAVLAPLAFVAYVLPNTQSLFTKWRKIFTAFLILYPAAAVFYGAVKFATILVVTDESSGFFESIIAWAVLFGSMIAIPFMLFKGNAATGKLFGALQKGVGKATGLNAAEKVGRSAMGARAKLGFQRFKNDSGSGRRTPLGLIRRGVNRYDKGSRDIGLDTGLEEKISEQNYREGVLGDENRVAELEKTAAGKSYIEGIESEAIKSSAFGYRNLSKEDADAKRDAAAAAGDHIGVAAWIDYQGTQGDSGHNAVAEFLAKDSLKDKNKNVRKKIVEHISERNPEMIGKDHRVKAWATNPEAKSWEDARRLANESIAEKGLSASKLSGLSTSALTDMFTTEDSAAARSGINRSVLETVADPSTQAGSSTQPVGLNHIQEYVQSSGGGSSSSSSGSGGGGGQVNTPVVGPGSSTTFTPNASGILVPNQQGGGSGVSSASPGGGGSPATQPAQTAPSPQDTTQQAPVAPTFQAPYQGGNPYSNPMPGSAPTAPPNTQGGAAPTTTTGNQSEAKQRLQEFRDNMNRRTK